MNESPNKIAAFFNSRLFTTILLLIGLPFSFALTSNIWVPFVLNGFKAPLVELSKNQDKGSVKEIVSGISTQLIDGIKEPFSKLMDTQQDDNVKNFEVAKTLEVKNVKTIPSPFPGQEKVIGTIYNGSDQTINNVHVTASFYDASGNLIDVSSQWLSNLKFVASKQSADFEFDWQYKDDKDADDSDDNTNTTPKPAPEKPKVTRKEASLKVVLSGFDVVGK
jgi:hypothetical protein